MSNRETNGKWLAFLAIVAILFPSIARCADPLLGVPEKVIGQPGRCEALAFGKAGLAAFMAGEGARLYSWPDAKEKAFLPVAKSGFGPLGYSRDGTIAVGGPEQKSVQFWQPELGDAASPGITLQERGAMLDVVAFSPTESLVAVGDHVGKIFLFSTKTGELKRELNGHIATIWALAWSRDGKRLASSSGDNDVCLWEVDSGKLIRRFDALTHSIFALVWSVEGNQLYFGGASGNVGLWDAGNGKLIRESARQVDLILTLALSPDGYALIAGGLNPNAFVQPANLTVYDAKTLRVKRIVRAHAGAVNALAFSPDGKSIVSASGSEPGIKSWNLRQMGLEE